MDKTTDDYIISYLPPRRYYYEIHLMDWLPFIYKPGFILPDEEIDEQI